jgi:6-phospho-3-hexuloisomerase
MTKKPSEVASDKVVPCIKAIVSHIEDTASQLDKKNIEKMIKVLFKVNRIFLMGAGRSGLVARAFAMRLMHLGFNVYFVGETTTPSVKKNDAVVAISGSGETLSITNLAKIAKELGATIIAITSEPDSTLGKLSDVMLVVKGRKKVTIEDYMERRMRGEYKSLAPLGTLFEITSLILLDAVIAQLMALTGKSEIDMKEMHAVLE